MKKLRMTKLFVILLAMIFLLSGCVSREEIIDVGDEKLASLEELNKHTDILSSEEISVNGTYSSSTFVYKIRYKSDNFEVTGYIGAPKDYIEKKYPVLIYNRGGNNELGKIEAEDIAFLAASGCVVLGSQYRGNDGGTGIEQFGGDDVNDVIKLIDISEDFGFALHGGVYMFGVSRGGMMTYNAIRRDNRIVAAAVYAGITDVTAIYDDRDDMKEVLEELIGGSPEEASEEYERRSAVKWAGEINTPIFIGHGGEADWRVKTEQSEKLAESLEIYNKEYKLIVYEDADHSPPRQFFIDMKSWFEEHPIK